ncbi:MAG: superoxide dismutase [Candidatus Liptonbacteria bacterium RIFCSPLOWO2_01_FULL_52_25]|uniref:Superoxide dismutase n=1 Tax=Candidatus Liptonbacteria bacterium RIFCSPLOWO2_01_FULL_52_25 TaxID=1798650 RepID=A0A1G2CE54_9BACT|nr:MAG: superoxide dismutase [Candidatus Liptonbacteria bacterium RIFCSPLOWO2_01_FULL_52_25]
MQFELPKLPYRFDALEPYIDARTMETHYAKHHQTYVTKLNDALAKHPEFEKGSLMELLASLDSVPEDIRTAVRNHGGGHWNHSFFWKILTPPIGGGGGEPPIVLGTEIKRAFGDFATFKERFTQAAAGVFGSGWAWLILDPNKNKELKVITTSNQDSPVSQGLWPILGLDVWEHAYYLLYQNRRPDYISAFWNIVNWEEVQKNFEETI